MPYPMVFLFIAKQAALTKHSFGGPITTQRGRLLPRNSSPKSATNLTVVAGKLSGQGLLYTHW